MTFRLFWLIVLQLLNTSVDGETVGEGEERPVVHTKLGLIRGVKASDGEYNMFMGIPYAQVNKSNPFGDSIPHPKFDDTFEANNGSRMCPHRNTVINAVTGTLDCLTLNIYIPHSINTINPMAVMVYIYGGAFKTGSADYNFYGPQFLVKQGIILITLNYRSGPYGFLCLDVPEVPGNQGIKDQIVALRWVRDNIESFGGNRDKVTIAGDSSGAICTHWHLLCSDANEKLFDKAIISSGTAFYPNVIGEPNNTVPLKIAEHLGLKTNDVRTALAYIANSETNSVIEADNKLNIVYKLCLEKHFDNVTNLITDYPYNLQTPRVTNISILIGNTEKESDYSFVGRDLSYFRKETLIPSLLDPVFTFTKQDLQEVSEMIGQFYLTGDDDTEHYKQGMADFVSDFTYNFQTRRSLDFYDPVNGAKKYFYIFPYTGGRNVMKNQMKMTHGAATHADEIGYLFYSSLPVFNGDAPHDKIMIDRLTNMWANFVKFGDPTPETSELLPVKWKPITEEAWYYMNIDKDLNLYKRPFHQRMAFWDMFYNMYGKLQKGYREHDTQ